MERDHRAEEGLGDQPQPNNSNNLTMRIQLGRRDDAAPPNPSDVRSMVLRMGSAPAERVERFATRLIRAGAASSNVNHYRSVLALEITAIKNEEDWQYLSYPSWDEFHEDLAALLGIGESTSWRYIKTVRYAKEVLGLNESEFLKTGGVFTVSRMLAMSKIDGRRKGSWAETVLPATVEFKNRLEQEEGDDWPGRMRSFYLAHIAFDDGPGVINKTPGELNSLVDEALGRPSVWWTRESDVLRWHCVYISGEYETGRLIPDTALPHPVESRLMRLGFREEGE